MRLLILLCVLLAFNLSFQLIDESLPARDWWPFDDNRYMLTPEWYWHEVQGKVSFMIICFVLAYEARQLRTELLIFAWLMVFDFVDFLLTNNTAWFHVGIIPVSANMVIPAIFVLAILNYGRLRD